MILFLWEGEMFASAKALTSKSENKKQGSVCCYTRLGAGGGGGGGSSDGHLAPSLLSSRSPNP